MDDDIVRDDAGVDQFLEERSGKITMSGEREVKKGFECPLRQKDIRMLAGDPRVHPIWEKGEGLN